LNAQRKAINGSKVLIVGLAYKADVDDDRESPSYVLLDLFHQRGATVAYYDPYVPVVRPTREHPHWAGTKSVAWNKETLASFDIVLIATKHASINYRELGEWSRCIVDTRNAMVGIPLKADQLWKA
jgi:UDP-N-acetyl-D-glucosamine dehydrogenase